MLQYNGGSRSDSFNTLPAGVRARYFNLENVQDLIIAYIFLELLTQDKPLPQWSSYIQLVNPFFR